MSTTTSQSAFSRFITADRNNLAGVPKFNIYLLRIMFFLMAVFLGKDAWGYMLSNGSNIEPMEAIAWSLWAAYALMAAIGFFQPIKMLPIVLLEIIYKVIWLAFIVWPLYNTNQLTGSSAEDLVFPFMLVILPIVAMPWRYFYHNFIKLKLS